MRLWVFIASKYKEGRMPGDGLDLVVQPQLYL